MKKISYLGLVLFLLFTTNASALSWAIIFVVHDGKVYEVKEDITINQTELGEQIGKVETKPDEQSGDYYGNASNYYEIGTRYFEIEDISPDHAIAVEEEQENYVKAEYVHDAPFHIKSILPNIWVFLGIGLILLVGITVLRSKQS